MNNTQHEPRTTGLRAICGHYGEDCTANQPEQPQHTPAPWVLDMSQENRLCDTNDNTICIFETWDDQVSKNARLISAAPELLEALKLSQKILLELLASRSKPIGQEVFFRVLDNKIGHLYTKSNSCRSTNYDPHGKTDSGTMPTEFALHSSGIWHKMAQILEN